MFTDDACQLTYRVFHVYFTIPPTLVLALLARPFLTQLDRLKLLLLPLVAFVWTTAWDSELIRRRAWGYPRACVLGTVWRIPLEEYFFFLIQSVMTTLVTTLLTRWILPPLYLQPKSSKSAGTLAPACYVGICVSGLALAFASTNEHTYYLGMILWWSSIPLILLTWGAAGYIADVCSPTSIELSKRAHRPAWMRTLTVLACVALPTGYLWFADVFALRRGTWFISRHTSLEVFIIPDLPIEEATFFFVTNLILVVACFAFDRCIAVTRFYPGDKKQLASSEEKNEVSTAPLAPVHLPVSWSSIRSMLHAFISDVQEQSDTGKIAPAGLTVDSSAELAAHLSILSSASRSFSLASLLMPWDLRADLGSVYAFCRASDNLIDHADSADGARTSSEIAARKAKRLDLLRQLVLLACGDAQAAQDGKEKEKQQSPMSTQARKQLIALRLQSYARSERLPENGGPPKSNGSVHAHADQDPLADVGIAASILVDTRDLIPRELWNELLDGYAIDLGMDAGADAGKAGALPSVSNMETLDDLGEYAQCVAGAVGEMCVRVVLGRVGRPLPSASACRRETLSEMLLAIGRHPSRTLPAEEYASQHQREAQMSAEERLLLDARRMGVALQLINIARDIVSDSRALRRSYLPRELFVERDAWMSDALRAGSIETSPSSTAANTRTHSRAHSEREDSANGTGSAGAGSGADEDADAGSLDSSPTPSVRIEREVPPALIKAYRRRLLALAQALYDASYPTLAALPCPPARSGLRVACAVYADIARAVLVQGDDAIREGKRARSSRWRRVFVALRALYSF